MIKAKRALIEGDVSVKTIIETIEREIRAISLSQMRGSQIRSRVKWLEGEKPTKFIFTLEATRAQKNTVQSIYNSAGVEVFSQDSGAFRFLP